MVEVRIPRTCARAHGSFTGEQGCAGTAQGRSLEGFKCQSSRDHPPETSRRQRSPRKLCLLWRALEVWADSRGEWSPRGPPACRQGMRKLPEEVAVLSCLWCPALGLLYKHFPDTFPVSQHIGRCSSLVKVMPTYTGSASSS